jgi:hypothetical protein
LPSSDIWQLSCDRSHPERADLRDGPNHRTCALTPKTFGLVRHWSPSVPSLGPARGAQVGVIVSPQLDDFGRSIPLALSQQLRQPRDVDGDPPHLDVVLIH